jgi:hypothetical protein
VDIDIVTGSGYITRQAQIRYRFNKVVIGGTEHNNGAQGSRKERIFHNTGRPVGNN